MSRDLKAAESTKNQMTFSDQLNGGELITLYYRAPSTDERIQYKSAIVRAAMSKQPGKVFDLQLTWAEKLITGFKEGNFTLGDKPISTDKDNENYYDGWWQVLKAGGADILWTWCDTVLGSPNFVVKDNGDEPNFSLNN